MQAQNNYKCKLKITIRSQTGTRAVSVSVCVCVCFRTAGRSVFGWQACSMPPSCLWPQQDTSSEVMGLCPPLIFSSYDSRVGAVHPFYTLLWGACQSKLWRTDSTQTCNDLQDWGSIVRLYKHHYTGEHTGQLVRWPLCHVKPCTSYLQRDISFSWADVDSYPESFFKKKL